MIIPDSFSGKAMKKGMKYAAALLIFLLLAGCSTPPTPITTIITATPVNTFTPEKINTPTLRLETETPQPQPTVNPIIPTRPNNLNSMNYLPQPGDNNLKRDPAYIDTVQIIASQDSPPLAIALINGSLPTPCNQLRLQLAPDHPQNLIKIEAYSLIDPNAVCAQMITSFEVNLPLGTLQAGKYSLAVNDKSMSNFQWPLP